MEQSVLLGVINNYYCIVAAAALYLYDFALTFSDSVELVWCRKMSPASMLYILNRYLTIPYLAFQLLIIGEKDCARAYVAQQVANGFVCSLLVVFAALSAIRVYSLSFYGFDWKLPTLVTSLVLFQVGSCIYIYSDYRPEVLPPPVFCVINNNTPSAINNALKIAMRVLNVVHDALILLFTWYKTKGNLRKYIGVVKLQNNLVTRMLLNGAVYFIVHLILNILDIVLTVTGTFSDVTIFNAIFTPLILSHFFLSIREDHRTREDLASTSSQIESQMLRFDLHIAVEGLAGLDEDETRRSAARVRLL